MKTVFSNNAEVCHIWAQRNHPQGRAYSIIFEGDSIYSWSVHYPLARFIDTPNETIVLVNDDSHTPSTNKHRSLVRRAIPDKYRVLDIGDTLHYVHDFESLQVFLDDILENHEKQVIDYAEKARRARLHGDIYVLQALAITDKALYLLQFHNDKRKEDYKCFLSFFESFKNNDSGSIRDKAEKARQKAQERIKAKLAEDSRLWLAGHSVKIYDYPETLMRIAGDYIQTSKGVQFPIEQAKQAFFIIKKVMESGQTVNFTENKPKLGYYEIDRIESGGNVKAGCHYVRFDQIDKIAAQLGLS